jgi:hypothetical protein
LGPAREASPKENGPQPLIPAEVSGADFHKLPASIRLIVKSMGK